jgi:membrane fusion protein, adhesin transport system
VPDDLAAMSPAIIASERALLVARQADYLSRTEGAAMILAETRRELEVMEDLYAREIAALIELTRARKANGDAESRYNEVVTTADLERAGALSEVLQEIGTLRQNLRLAQDQLARTVVTSPMRGVVNAVGVATIGGVIRPGEEIFQIIPAGDTLYIEARVRPADIANVVVGQAATIKLSAYDYTIYGGLSGEVVNISADTFADERRADLPPHYKVTLSVDLENLTERQRNFEIRPGMLAAVELYTGQKTVLQYLTRPLYRGSEAMREPVSGPVACRNLTLRRRRQPGQGHVQGPGECGQHHLRKVGHIGPCGQPGQAHWLESVDQIGPQTGRQNGRQIEPCGRQQRQSRTAPSRSGRQGRVAGRGRDPRYPPTAGRSRALGR